MATVATRTDVYRDNGNTLQIQALFRGQLFGTRHMEPGCGAARGRGPAQYVIGAIANADAPVGQDVIGGDSLPLITTWGNDYLVNVTPKMGGELRVDGHAVRLQDYVRERGCSFTLPPQGRARVDCGEVVFVLGRTHAAERMPRPWLALRWAEQKYTAIAAALLGLFLLIVLAIPPDTRSLSLESLNWGKNYVSTVVLPPVEDKLPDWLTAKRPDGAGDSAKAHAGDPGAAGSSKTTVRDGRIAVKKPRDSVQPLMTKELSESQARNAGVMGVLNGQSPQVASIFSRDMAIGNDPEDVLSNLVGVQISDAADVGGLGPLGTGAGGGGTGRTIGSGTLTTIGSAARGSGGPNDYGRNVGRLAEHRRTTVPQIVQGVASVRGSLDKEIVRRIVRTHMNEVKFCYDQELARSPTLAGRISVQFSISPTGQVLTSVMQSTSMDNARVENCVVNAVRRWEFPKPTGGGLVIVLYPFSFSSAGV